jgi:hypothetical protein
MSDWVAPIILAVLAFLMSMGIKTLQGIIDDTKIMDDASSNQQRGGSGRSSSTSTRRNRPSSLNTTIHDHYIPYEDPFMIKLFEGSTRVRSTIDVSSKYFKVKIIILVKLYSTLL